MTSLNTTPPDDVRVTIFSFATLFLVKAYTASGFSLHVCMLGRERQISAFKVPQHIAAVQCIEKLTEYSCTLQKVFISVQINLDLI